MYSNRPLKKTIKLTNNGRRHQQLVWSTDGFSALGKAKKDMANYNPLDMKFRVGGYGTMLISRSRG